MEAHCKNSMDNHYLLQSSRRYLWYQAWPTKTGVFGLKLSAIADTTYFRLDPNCTNFSCRNSLLVSSFTDWKAFPFLYSLNESFIMHLYFLFLYGIITTGQIFNFPEILSSISFHLTTLAYFWMICSCISWLSCFMISFVFSDICGTLSKRSGIFSWIQHVTQSTGQPLSAWSTRRGQQHGLSLGTYGA